MNLSANMNSTKKLESKLFNEEDENDELVLDSQDECLLEQI